MTQVADALEAFTQAFEREPGTPRRREAFERFKALGFPTTRLEDWRFTNVAPIARSSFVAPAGMPGHEPEALALGSWPHASVVCANGRFLRASLPEGGLAGGGRATSLAVDLREDGDSGPMRWLGSVARDEEHAFTALNSAFLDDGLYVHIPSGVRIELPIHASFLTSTSRAAAAPGPVATHPRVLIVLEANARLTLIEDYRGASPGGSFANAVTEVVLGEGATLEHVSLLGGASDGDGFHVGTVYVRQEAGSHFTARTFALGGRLVRRDVRIVFTGEGAGAQLDGLYVVTGKEHVDHHTLVDHAVPSCQSRELYKGVLTGESHAVFNGAVLIRPGAQKSDANQSNKNLLLSLDATINTKPELRIFADDVKCGHGATVGQLDEQQLFYLRTRGIAEPAARAILTHAFAREIVDRVPHEGLRADLDAWVFARMEAAALQGGKP